MFKVMKKNLFILAMFSLLFASCSNDWDDYYNEGGYKPDYDYNNTEIVDLTLPEFFEEYSEYSGFYDVFSRFDTLTDQFTRDQKLTVWVVNNSNLQKNPIGLTELDTVQTMYYHMNNLAIVPEDLTDGSTVLTFGGNYMTVTRPSADKIYIDYDPEKGDDNFYIVKSYSLSDGNMVHELSSLLTSRITLYDYIKLLPDEYSWFRDSVLAREIKVFNINKSRPYPELDPTGNTVYDSVFDIDNTLWVSRNPKGDAVTITSPIFINYSLPGTGTENTLLYASNAVIEAAQQEAYQYIEDRGMAVTDNWKAQIDDWIFKVMFHRFTGIFPPPTDVAVDKKSVYSQHDAARQLDVIDYIYRHQLNGPNELDYSSMAKCNNGEAYEITKLKVPNYELIGMMYYYRPATRQSYEMASTFRGNEVIGSLKLWDHLPEATYGNSYAGDVDNYNPNALTRMVPKKNGFTEYVSWNYQGRATLEDPEFSIMTPILVAEPRGSLTPESRIQYVPTGWYNISLSGHPSNTCDFDFFISKDFGATWELIASRRGGNPRVEYCQPTASNRQPSYSLTSAHGPIEVINNHPTNPNLGTIYIRVMRAAAGTYKMTHMELAGWHMQPVSDNY